MAAPWRKRRKFQRKEDDEEFTAKYPEIVIFIVNARIQRVRLEHLRRLARKKGFVISSELNDTVTHVVTEIDSKDHAVSILQRITRSQRIADFDVLEFAQKKELLSLKWFTSCMEEGKPVEVTDEHRLPAKKPVDPNAEEEENGDERAKNPKFACQRITPLNHANKKYTDALEMLERASELRMGDSSRSKALAFRKASAALKALPEEIKSAQDVENLYDLRGGSHCKRVIMDILERGYSSEVERISRSGWYTCMSLFTGVFGCGISTAAKWCHMGLMSLADVKGSYILNLTRSQLKGMEYYEELNSPVTIEEAEWIHGVIAEELAALQPESTVEITGGFRRGKDTGHDVDFLISHPVEGKEKGILGSLLQALAKKNYLDYTDIQNSNLGEKTVQKGVGKANTMDHFERCFSIFRLPKSAASRIRIEPAEGAETSQGDAPAAEMEASSSATGATAPSPISTNGVSSTAQTSGTSHPSRKRSAPEDDADNDPVASGEPWPNSGRSWVAKRVDFVVAPVGQYAFALLGWTGSKMFNRSMRDYANKVMNMNLSSHGLYDKTNNCSLTAKTEEEIFELLKLEYRQHDERNC